MNSKDFARQSKEKDQKTANRNIKDECGKRFSKEDAEIILKAALVAKF